MAKRVLTPYEAFAREQAVVRRLKAWANHRDRMSFVYLRDAQAVCEHSLKDSGGGMFGFVKCTKCGVTDL